MNVTQHQLHMKPPNRTNNQPKLNNSNNINHKQENKATNGTGESVSVRGNRKVGGVIVWIWTLLCRLARLVFPLSLVGLIVLHNYSFLCAWKVKGFESAILLIGDPQIRGEDLINRGILGQFDLWFNDVYIRHVYQNGLKLLNPSLAVVLGDLFSSEWIGDEEFQRRAIRYNNIFESDSSKIKFVNLPGNHDIGYASSLTKHRLKRFEDEFGPANDVFIFRDHMFVVLNSMNIDESNDKELWNETRTFIEKVSKERREPLILLTHIPLYKEAGFCVDPPLIETWRKAVTKQNMLSKPSSEFLLNSLQPEWIFTGHDHEGCSYVHTYTNEKGETKTTKEETIRSIMADFSGNFAFLEMEKNSEGFNYNFGTCIFLDYIYSKIFILTSLIAGFISGFILLIQFCLQKQSKKQKRI